ncbi:MAG TPA: hypothetical protein VNZ26_15635 [Vicinamibacterales bacterium]|jgi:hypothetical protein|nr:hypothetical protein [Vicinamibacterales bacterium]
MTTIRFFAPPVFLPLVLLLLAMSGTSANAQTTPRIIFTEAPALLIQIDGEPTYRHIEGTKLDRLVNTEAIIVRDPAGLHYLKVLDGWMEAYSLTGSWSVSGVSPLTFNQDWLAAFNGDRQPASTSATVPSSSPGVAEPGPMLQANPPTIYIATEPSVLIVTDGPPRYESISGTSLKRLVNTTTAFKEPTDDELYVFVTERWFRAWTTDGPWELVPADRLPSDIARQIALNGLPK